MKSNNKSTEQYKLAVSAVIGIILIVAITIAVAAVTFFQYSGLLGGMEDYTASVACIADSSTDRITITTVSPIIKWSDIGIAVDNSSVNWQAYNPNHTPLDTAKSTSGAIAEVGAGDYIEFDFTSNPGMSGNIFVSLRFIPTNTLLGSWTITV
jgi:FlaG/FlaF family flagellin (archaellin)